MRSLSFMWDRELVHAALGAEITARVGSALVVVLAGCRMLDDRPEGLDRLDCGLHRQRPLRDGHATPAFGLPREPSFR